MARLRINNIGDPTGSNNPLSLSGTTATWTSSPGFATLTAPDYYVIVSQPGTANEEISHLTAYTSGATTGTVVRAQEGTSNSGSPSSVAWQHGPTVLDFIPEVEPFMMGAR